MGRYTHKTYSAGFAIDVEPKDRTEDVLSYLITGHPLCGRSLDGVTWKRAENNKAAKMREDALRVAMRAG